MKWNNSLFVITIHSAFVNKHGGVGLREFELGIRKQVMSCLFHCTLL
jgi:hypothetical protein